MDKMIIDKILTKKEEGDPQNSCIKKSGKIFVDEDYGDREKWGVVCEKWRIV